VNKFSRDLVQGMREAAAFVAGKTAGARITPHPNMLPLRGSVRQARSRAGRPHPKTLPSKP
jgi:hypothetical protein